jgi:hypothetical protein
MASFKVRLAADAEAALRRLPFPLRRQVWQRITRLRSDPRPPDSREIAEDGMRAIDLHGCRILYKLPHEEGAEALILALRYT